ncbi:MAG: hypothetical protein Q9179_000474 [Wetmoreana sp. 5 TL-2023]
MSTNPAFTPGNGGISMADAYIADTYARRPDHTPQTAQPEAETYILALNTDAAHHQAVTALRKKHFPPTLNKLSAHIALFRALPGSEFPRIQTAIEAVVRQYHPFPISTGKPFLLSRGVAIEACVEPAKNIYHTLKEQWHSFLSNQDRSFRAHYTIQNKVEDREIARKTLDEVQNSFGGSQGTVTGLSLYLYDKGYWKLKKIYPFPENPHDAPSMRTTDEGEWPALPGADPSDSKVV